MSASLLRAVLFVERGPHGVRPNVNHRQDIKDDVDILHFRRELCEAVNLTVLAKQHLQTMSGPDVSLLESKLDAAQKRWVSLLSRVPGNGGQGPI
eukprot:gnl/MRDRNA2_/MRDRNA2_71340_c0_seq1.p1 gnl/MRDRNA2_/MRDRNA2_71340_c0~~gnl/MRDRNA2_/MRDRNA2_71340_c0_seq1.p1  ORF type:complete len:109 (-),score=15.21 gnl/MRDRNA2_/MRDRNA2_71340_c0_seq1:6-290(-)